VTRLWYQCIDINSGDSFCVIVSCWTDSSYNRMWCWWTL